MARIRDSFQRMLDVRESLRLEVDTRSGNVWIEDVAQDVEGTVGKDPSASINIHASSGDIMIKVLRP